MGYELDMSGFIRKERERLIKKCVRCGKCCKQGGPCDLRGWILHDRKEAHFSGICDQL